ncbi:MAG: glycosyltransferase family 4 protein [Myxococcota bacterium]
MFGTRRDKGRPRVFYAAGGPGDVLRAHRHWREQVPDTREISVTFSSQIADYCEAHASAAYFVSPHPEAVKVEDKQFVIEHRPRPMPNAAGIMYHLRELWYGGGLVATALRFRADVALLDSGATTYPVMFIFKLFGLKVIPILHMTLWPAGHRPSGKKADAFWFASSAFFRYAADAVVGVSPECLRQIDELTGGHAPPSFQALAQFWSHSFSSPTPPPAHDARFNVLYVGRLESNKGVFELVEAAATLERELPGRFHFRIFGEGAAADELRANIEERGLGNVVEAPGYLLPEDAPAERARSHVGIVPTRSDFNEGMAMTAIESILAGRPLVATSVVPASEVLSEATVVCEPDNSESIARALKDLASDEGHYLRLSAACAELGRPFLDRAQGLAEALQRAAEAAGTG